MRVSTPPSPALSSSRSRAQSANSISRGTGDGAAASGPRPQVEQVDITSLTRGRSETASEVVHRRIGARRACVPVDESVAQPSGRPVNARVVMVSVKTETLTALR